MGHTHARIGPDTSARVPDSRHDTPGGAPRRRAHPRHRPPRRPREGRSSREHSRRRATGPAVRRAAPAARGTLGTAGAAGIRPTARLCRAVRVRRTVLAAAAGRVAAGLGHTGVAGGALSGVTVASAVENALYDDGSDVEGVNCPDTAAAQVSTVVACTGTFDGDDWALIVYLLDEEGSILVTSY